MDLKHVHGPLQATGAFYPSGIVSEVSVTRKTAQEVQMDPPYADFPW